MFLNPLRIFHETVRNRSIRRASDALGMVPSSVSRQLVLFEREMGTTLLERSASGVSLTHAGGVVAEFASRVLLDFESLRSDLDDHKGGQRAFIRIAAVEGMVAAGPSEAIAKFRERFNRVTFALHMCPAPAVIALIKAGDADVGITFSPPPDLGLKTEGKLDEPLLLVTPKSEPLGGKPHVAVTDLAALPLALPSADFGMRRILDLTCQQSGFELNPVFVSDSFEALRHFVIQSGAAAILPKRALMLKDNQGIHWSPIVDKRLPRTTIEVISLKGRRPSRIMKLFIAQLMDTLSSHY
jgi:DNA-binding transcriptional LysR family regulator